MADGSSITVGIERLHLEQDAGKSLHDQDPTRSFVDLNRSGVALMEIVSRPDLRSSEEAKAYVTKLRTILRYLGTCDGDMEKGSLRADVNVSVRLPGEPLGTRCEIKNVNSIRFIGQAIETEARRQIAILEDGGKIDQETRLFDPGKCETRSMRSKEEAHDYRYFPDPDLLPLEFDQAFVDGLAEGLPELPDAKKARFVADYGLSPYDAGVLVAERASANYYEAVAKGRDGKAAANWVINELFGRLNKEGLSIEASPVSAAQLGAIVDLIGEDVISGKIAKDLFEIVWTEGGDPRALVESRGMKQVTDTGAIAAIVLLSLMGLSLLAPSVSERITRPFVALGARLSSAADSRRGSESGRTVASSVLLGVATGLLWAPCAGPILGLILAGAAIQGPSVRTSLLLLSYAAGAMTSLAFALLLGGKVFAAMKRSLGVGEWFRRALGVAVLAGVTAIALGLDTGLLAQLSSGTTDTLEKTLSRHLRPGAQHAPAAKVGHTRTVPSTPTQAAPS